MRRPYGEVLLCSRVAPGSIVENSIGLDARLCCGNGWMIRGDSLHGAPGWNWDINGNVLVKVTGLTWACARMVAELTVTEGYAWLAELVDV